MFVATEAAEISARRAGPMSSKFGLVRLVGKGVGFNVGFFVGWWTTGFVVEVEEGSKRKMTAITIPMIRLPIMIPPPQWIFARPF
jgi:hypothetical protein